MVTARGLSVTSRTASQIIRLGTGLMAGSPTGTPRPGLVTTPTPSPPSRRSSLAKRTKAWISAPWVTSGSSPASLIIPTRTPSPFLSRRKTRKGCRHPAGSQMSTTSGASPRRARAAALAAAAAFAPVVKPMRLPFLSRGGG